MQPEQLRQLLHDVRTGQVDVERAMERLKNLPYEDLGFVKLDSHRELRRGFPEVVFCQGKTTDQVVQICGRLRSHADTVLATRASADVATAIREAHPEAVYHALARCVVLGEMPEPRTEGTILVVTAGTADIPVAEEAVLTARLMGNRVLPLYDVGVAGLHRLLSHREDILRANVLITVAGMDGALPSVVAGLVDKPVIAVPTSVGYGASFGGIAPLLTMLNACSPGIAVVNIDNGFGAGYLASTINQMNHSAGASAEE